MKTKKVTYFTEDEEKIIDLLAGIGMQINVARVLVFLSRTSEATSHAIEKGTGLRQPAASVAMHYLEGQGWIEFRTKDIPARGRPAKISALVCPLAEIIRVLEAAKEKELAGLREKIRELKKYTR